MTTARALARAASAASAQPQLAGAGSDDLAASSLLRRQEDTGSNASATSLQENPSDENEALQISSPPKTKRIVISSDAEDTADEGPSGGLFGLGILPSFAPLGDIASRFNFDADDDALGNFDHYRKLYPLATATFPPFRPVPYENPRDPPQAFEEFNVLSNLPVDVLALVFHLSQLKDIYSVRLVSKNTNLVATHSPVWKSLCLRTGKIDKDTPRLVASSGKSDLSPQFVEELQRQEPNDYFALYRTAVNVPVDVPDIKTAVRVALTRGLKLVTIMPGTYDERIILNKDAINHAMINGSFGAGVDYTDGIDLTIKGADKDNLTTIVHTARTGERVSPTILISNPNDQGISQAELGNGFLRVTLKNLSIGHHGNSRDIWSSNVGVYASGDAQLSLHGCFVTSSSGRGIVINGGASAGISDSTIYGCAATGLYCGDEDTNAVVMSTNIINNGYGGRSLSPPLPSGSISDMLAILESSLSVETEPSELGDDDDNVPPGHSGAYVEAASVSFDECLIANSCLTGLTVVREGKVRLNGTDVLGNGAEPVSVEDIFLTRRAQRGQDDGVMIGGTISGPKPNNLQEIAPSDEEWTKLFRKPHNGALTTQV